MSVILIGTNNTMKRREPLRVLLIVGMEHDGLNDPAVSPLSLPHHSFQNQIQSLWTEYTNRRTKEQTTTQQHPKTSSEREVETCDDEQQRKKVDVQCISSPDGGGRGRTLEEGEDGLMLKLHSCRLSTKDPLPSTPVEVLQHYDALMISGSFLMVTDMDPWTVQLMTLIKGLIQFNDHLQQRRGDEKGPVHATQTGSLLRSVPLPILGICFGHQLINLALGGNTTYNPKGRTLGTVQHTELPTTHSERLSDPIFGGSFPDAFPGNCAHSQIAADLPPPRSCADLTEGLSSIHCVSFYTHHNGGHNVVRFGQYIYGVQWHPEFNTEYMEALCAWFKVPECEVQLCETSSASCHVVGKFIELAFEVTRATQPL